VPLPLSPHPRRRPSGKRLDPVRYLRIGLLFAVVVAAALPVRSVASPGGLDPSFAGDGTVLSTLPERGSWADRIAALPDGGAVVVGISYRNRGDSLNNLVVERYGSDGSLDSSFGRGGIVTTTIPGAYIGDGPGEALEGTGAAVSVQPDGRIVVVTTAMLASQDGEVIVAARYQPDGSRDTSFGRNGVQLIHGSPTCGLRATDTAVAGDGAIVVAGAAGCLGQSQLIVARLTSQGRLDRSFAGDGVWTTWTACVGSSIALASDGSIVVAGKAAMHHHCANGMYAARLRGDGTLDARFGRGGRVVVRFRGSNDAAAADVALGREDRIVLAGSAANYDSNVDDVTRSALAIARLLPTGRLDASFATAGRLLTRLPGAPLSEALSLAIAPDDAIVVAGAAGSSRHRRRHFIVGRYLPSGALDLPFGRSGIQTVFFGAADEAAYSVALANPGAIFAAGYSFRGRTQAMAISRVLSQ
jgi:uncharacterized delta-60 repeat protein